jgi:branched-chain amino acid transport system substrate-binding protein
MARIASLVSAAALAIGALSSPAIAASVKVGFFTPVSGPLAGIGAMYKPTIEYVVGPINAAGGWHGDKIRVDIYDDAGTTQGAADRFRQAIADGVRSLRRHLTA